MPKHSLKQLQANIAPNALGSEGVHTETPNGSFNGLPHLSIQPKLTVGAPDDIYEKEADAMADRVMRMPEPGFIQRKCAQCEEEDEKINRKPLFVTPFIQTKSDAGVSASTDVASGINSSRGSGSSLDGQTQSFMSSRFGNDFSDVKIHTDGQSAQLNRSLNAKAFTVGNDVYFNEGQYRPQSPEGKKLLAHELTHTLQQGNITDKVQRAAWVCDEYTQSPTGSYSPGPGISISWNGSAVTISANLEIYGPSSSATVATEIKNSIENYWAGNLGSGYSVTSSVNVTVRAAGAGGDSGRTQINCLPGTGVSNVMPSYWVVGSRMMNYYVGDSSPTWTPAHEFGHLLGLGDRYSENWFVQIFGSKRTSTPDEGWSGNIMAAVGGVVEAKNIQEMLGRYAMECSSSHLESPI